MQKAGRALPSKGRLRHEAAGDPTHAVVRLHNSVEQDAVALSFIGPR